MASVVGPPGGDGNTRSTVPVGRERGSKSGASRSRRASEAARSSFRSTSAPSPDVPRCIQLIQSFRARNRRVPSNGVAVPVERLVLRPVRRVVLGGSMERPQAGRRVAARRARRCRRPGRTTCAGRPSPSRRARARHPVAVTRRQSRRPAVGGVDVEPQLLPAGERLELGNEVDRARVRRAGDRRDAEGRDPGRIDPRRSPTRPARGAGGTVRRSAPPAGSPAGSPACRDHERSRNAPDRSRRREPLEIASARRRPEPSERRKVDVASDRQRHDVRHHAAGGQDPPRAIRHPRRGSRSHPMTSSSTNAPTGPACQTSTPCWSHWDNTSPAIDMGSGGGVK